MNVAHGNRPAFMSLIFHVPSRCLRLFLVHFQGLLESFHEQITQLPRLNHRGEAGPTQHPVDNFF